MSLDKILTHLQAMLGIMIVGSGMIATALRAFVSDEITLFASGVSDSLETRVLEFERERRLLENTISSLGGSRLVYISSCSLYDSTKASTPYFAHKLEMEGAVLAQQRGSVIRLPNIVGPGGNRSNLVNYFAHAVKTGQPLFVDESARRFLMGIDEVTKLTSAYLTCPGEKQIVDIVPPRSTGVLEIVDVLEGIFGRPACLKIQRGGSSYEIDNASTIRLAEIASLQFPIDYSRQIIEKWHKKNV